MNRIRLLFLTGILAGVLARPGRAQGNEVILATTTSTYDSGLLDSILPDFEAQSGLRVKIISVGTGAALAMGKRGDVDVVLVHAPELELGYVRAGDLVAGRLLMHNDFLLAGPADDPAGVKACTSLECAMQAIARKGVFISRGDRSGTHEKELKLWSSSGINPDSVRRVETGQGMGATLAVAGERRAYTLTDRATFLTHSAAANLTAVFEGDPALLNIYHIYAVNPARHPRVNHKGALALIEFMTRPATQRAIGTFLRNRYGRSLYVPDVGRDSTRLHEATP